MTANKDLIQKIFAGFAERNGTLFYESLAEDATWTNIGSGSWAGPFRDKQSIVQDLLTPLRTLLAARPRTVAHRFIADGECVAVEAQGDNLTKAGKTYRNQYCFVFRLAEGKIVEIMEYSDTVMIAEVLGERPSLASATSP